MAVPASGRTRRVTGPLDDKVKACLRGEDERHPLPGCSSSEHGAADLSGLVRGFLFSEIEPAGSEPDDGGEEDEPSSAAECSFYAAPSAGTIRDLVKPTEDRFRKGLEAAAMAAAARWGGLRGNPASFRRSVMASLRESGYNAGICKSRWESGGGRLVAGSYEYIDVLTGSLTSPLQRYIVDADFAGEFEIARPTAEYARLVAELPRVFVGIPEALRRLLAALSEAARRSLRERELHVPPWRRSRFVQAKWLGPYRRSVNSFPSSPPSSSSSSAAAAPNSVGPGRGDVKRQFVGFDAASSAVLSPAAGSSGS